MLSQAISYITPEQYLESERRALNKSEYLDGQIYAMAGASPRHILIGTNMTVRLIGTNMTVRLALALEGASCLVFNSDMPCSTMERRPSRPQRIGRAPGRPERAMMS